MIEKQEFEEILSKLEGDEEWTLANKELLRGFIASRRDRLSKSVGVISKLLGRLNEYSGSKSSDGWKVLFTEDEAKEINDYMDYSDRRQ